MVMGHREAVLQPACLGEPLETSEILSGGRGAGSTSLGFMPSQQKLLGDCGHGRDTMCQMFLNLTLVREL